MISQVPQCFFSQKLFVKGEERFGCACECIKKVQWCVVCWAFLFSEEGKLFRIDDLNDKRVKVP